jgi:hypothetical protein
MTTPESRRLTWRSALPLVVLVGAACGCGRYNPRPVDAVPLQQSVQTKTESGFTVAVAVPTDTESEQLFGTPTASRGIQPVWLRIENRNDNPYWFSPLGLDPDYFTPFEAANRCRYRFPSAANKHMRDHFASRHIGNYIGAGETIDGFVFTNLDRGMKAVNVDLIGPQGFEQIFFLVDVPNLQADYHEVDFKTLYAAEEIRDVSEEELRATLEQLPCCATTASGQGVEDPLNFALVGTAAEVFPGFVRSGWHVTEVLQPRSALKTFWSYFFSSSYKYAPISPIYLFGRRQDISLQKTRETARERNHLRIWLTSWRLRGKPVWVGQISRDIGLAFSWKTFVGHEVDPDLDETRNYPVLDLIRSEAIARLGWVKGVGATPRSAPRHMDDGTPFFTDGLRAVLVFDEEPRPLDEIQRLDWERLRPR